MGCWSSKSKKESDVVDPAVSYDRKNVREKIKKFQQNEKPDEPPPPPPPRLEVHEPTTHEDWDRFVKNLDKDLFDLVEEPLKFVQMGLRDKEMTAVTLTGLVTSAKTHAKTDKDRAMLAGDVQKFSQALQRAGKLKLQWAASLKNGVNHIDNAKYAIDQMLKVGRPYCKQHKIALISDGEVAALFRHPEKEYIRNKI
mmetsp:Transcript_8295/g.14213  ORF Transcript_8295/g.14213 Transcript_8295/m.14213 type:complete len:197 (+) Transcript_8295:53-643(+)